MGLFNKSKNMDTLCLGFLHFDNSLRSIRIGFNLAAFSNPREALKIVLSYIILRCFQNFFPIMNQYCGS